MVPSLPLIAWLLACVAPASKHPGDVRVDLDATGALITVGTAPIRLETVAIGRGEGARVGSARPSAPCVGTEDPGCAVRVEFVRATHTEWWAAAVHGVEQGWTLASRPEGDGLLRIIVHVEGGTASLVGAEVELRQGGGTALIARAPVSTDAEGRVLATSYATTADGFAIDVDDQRAIYPITVDPLYQTPTWTAAGDRGFYQFGLAVAGAGDVNGDGFDDVIVGAEEERVLVFHGSPTAPSGEPDTILNGPQGSLFGTSIAAAGDVNLDGFADIVVGAPMDGGLGRAFVYLGSPRGLGATPYATFSGGVAGDAFGSAVAYGDDVDGDGRADLLVGAPGANSRVGRVSVFRSTSTGFSAPTVLAGSGTGSRFGEAVTSAGDVNGDGFSDVLVGAPGFSGDMGQAQVFLGSSAGVVTSPIWTARGRGTTQEFGAAVAGGDLDHDGFDDIAVAMPGFYSDTGEVRVHRGSPSGPVAAASLVLTGPQFNSRFGESLSIDADFDQDGFHDLLVGAPRYRNGGAAHIYSGGPSGPTSVPYATYSTDNVGAFGFVLAAAGDVDGDGDDDVIAGRRSYSADYGDAYVYEGGPSGLTFPPHTLTGALPDEFGRTAAFVGDLDGDGFQDMVVGAPRHWLEHGRVSVFYGAAAGPATTPDLLLTGTGVEDQFSYSLDGAGDVDGDGFDDLVVGAFSADHNHGRADVFLGSAVGLSSVPAWSVTGAPDVFLGESVAGVGDVDGDGFSDVGVSEKDRSSLYFGGPLGLSVSSDYAVFGLPPANRESVIASAGDVDGDGYGDLLARVSLSEVDVHLGGAAGPSFGCSVRAPSGYLGRDLGRAGDVDDDGLDDVILGAPSTLTNGGAAYVYLASGGCIPAAPTTTLAIGTNNEHFGFSVAALGDVDRDGFDDVGVTASGDAPTPYGHFYLFRGSSAGVSTSPDTTLTSQQDTFAFGEGLSAGDIDGDGWVDVLIGDRMAHAGRVSGRAWLFEAYIDADADGFPLQSDCDDTLAMVNPGAVEVCDPGDVDEDCDGVADDSDPSALGKRITVLDVDADSFPGTNGPAFCDPPSASLFVATDCDDTRAAVNPGAAEVCDDVNRDENCNGVADDADATVEDGGKLSFHRDSDADAYGVPDSLLTCDRPPGFVVTAGDCDDAQAAVHPGAVEVVGDAVDEDCDGEELCEPDNDEDGYRPASGVVGSVDADCDDLGEALATEPGGDCDDLDAAIHPGVVEAPGDGMDGDCDGLELCFVDGDRDGARSTAVVTSAATRCDAAGKADAAAPLDCDDADPASHPGAVEVVGDGVDEDCDGTELCLRDGDEDGYVVEGVPIVSSDSDCEDPGEALADLPAGDCDDANAAVRPGAGELCNELDDDCDGAVDVGTLDRCVEGLRVFGGTCGCDHGWPTGAWFSTGSVGLLLARRRRSAL